MISRKGKRSNGQRVKYGLEVLESIRNKYHSELSLSLDFRQKSFSVCWRWQVEKVYFIVFIQRNEMKSIFLKRFHNSYFVQCHEKLNGFARRFEGQRSNYCMCHSTGKILDDKLVSILLTKKDIEYITFH